MLSIYCIEYLVSMDSTISDAAPLLVISSRIRMMETVDITELNNFYMNGSNPEQFGQILQRYVDKIYQPIDEEEYIEGLYSWDENESWWFRERKKELLLEAMEDLHKRKFYSPFILSWVHAVCSKWPHLILHGPALIIETAYNFDKGQYQWMKLQAETVTGNKTPQRVVNAIYKYIEWTCIKYIGTRDPQYLNEIIAFADKNIYKKLDLIVQAMGELKLVPQ